MTKTNCKILLTTQSSEVSTQMMTNEDVKEYFLNEEGIGTHLCNLKEIQLSKKILLIFMGKNKFY